MNSSYDDSKIVSMKFLEHIRSKSGMWGFQLNNMQGLHQHIKEVVDNSVDEALDRSKLYTINITFFVSKDRSNYQCLIQDFGRGIPVNKLHDCYCKEFTSAKYRGEYGGSSVGCFGVGSKASAALSKLFIAFTKRDDGFGYLKIEKGVVKDYVTRKSRIDKDSSTIGTTVFLQPDDTMFSKINEMFKDKIPGEDRTGFEIYLEKLEYYSLFKPNVELVVRIVDGLLKPSDLNVDSVDLWRRLSQPDKFDAKVAFKSNLNEDSRFFVIRKLGLGEPIWELGKLHKDDDQSSDDILSYDIDVFTDDKTMKGNGGVIGAVNATPISDHGSSHISVLHQVIKDQLIGNLSDDDKQAYFENKYRLPLSGTILVGWTGAEFIGQDKSKFENRQFESCYRLHIRKAIKRLTEEKGEGIWDRLWELIHENFEMEYAKFSRTSYKTGGDLKNLCYDLKRKKSFWNCELRNSDLVKTELFITEGDSAAGRVSSERNEKTQAVLKLSGKPKNAIRDDGSKLKENDIYCDLCRIIGVSHADKDLKNMRFDKIIIMADADADGYHIVALMLGMLYKINPLILEEGRVCVTNPPLFSILHGNHAAYLRDVEALEEARISSYRTLFDIDMIVYSPDDKEHRRPGTVFRLNKDIRQFTDVCLIVNRIGELVTYHANLLNIEPFVLEQLVHCHEWLDEHNVNTKKICSTLMTKDVVWDKSNNVIVLVYESNDRSIEYRIPLTNLKSTIENELLPEFERFHWDDFDLHITTKYSDLYVDDPCSFLMLYTLFKKISDPDKGILKPRRFKGLGEMSKEAITTTCIDPKTRSFTTIRGVGDIDRIYKMLGVDTNERKKLVNSRIVEEV